MFGIAYIAMGFIELAIIPSFHSFFFPWFYFSSFADNLSTISFICPNVALRAHFISAARGFPIRFNFRNENNRRYLAVLVWFYKFQI